jgi:transcriptional regulator with XRE-family HTH domain
MPLGTQPVVEIHGYALRAVREAHGLSVSALAERLGKNRSYIAHLENGTKRNVSRPLYNAILRGFGITDFRALLATAPPRSESSAPVPLDPPVEAESA